MVEISLKLWTPLTFLLLNFIFLFCTIQHTLYFNLCLFGFCFWRCLNCHQWLPHRTLVWVSPSKKKASGSSPGKSPLGAAQSQIAATSSLTALIVLLLYAQYVRLAVDRQRKVPTLFICLVYCLSPALDIFIPLFPAPGEGPQEIVSE